MPGRAKAIRFRGWQALSSSRKDRVTYSDPMDVSLTRTSARARIETARAPHPRFSSRRRGRPYRVAERDERGRGDGRSPRERALASSRTVAGVDGDRPDLPGKPGSRRSLGEPLHGELRAVRDLARPERRPAHRSVRRSDRDAERDPNGCLPHRKAWAGRQRSSTADVRCPRPKLSGCDQTQAGKERAINRLPASAPKHGAFLK